MFLIRTLAGSTAVIDSTPITFGGVTNPTLPLGLNYSDLISNYSIVTGYDYYIVWYVASGANAAAAVYNKNTSYTSGYSVTGDATTLTTAPTPSKGYMYGVDLFADLTTYPGPTGAVGSTGATGPAFSPTGAANLIFATPNGSTGTASLRALVPTDYPVFGASGSLHTIGAVPDPGGSTGSTRYLREDGNWVVPAGGGTGSGGNGSWSDTIQSLGSVTTAQAPVTANGRYVKLTLGANIVLTLPNGSSSSSTEQLVFEITQDATGSRAISWAGSRKFSSGITPALTTTAGAIDIINFTWNGAYWIVSNFNKDVR